MRKFSRFPCVSKLKGIDTNNIFGACYSNWIN